MGISSKYYPVQVEAMWNMSREDARKVAEGIYRKDYWDSIGGDSLPVGLDLVAFDTAVNCGVGKSNSWMNLSSNPVDIIFLRLSHYAKLPNFNVFGRGWVNRVADLYKEVSAL